MQTPDALHRVAYECVEDLAADSVVYAEVRFAPELHIDRGLSFDEIVDSVLAGFADGEKASAAAGRPIVVRLLVTAMRHAAASREIAELAIRFRDKGVVGFDIAGAEAVSYTHLLVWRTTPRARRRAHRKRLCRGHIR